MCVFAPSKTIEEVWRALDAELKRACKRKTQPRKLYRLQMASVVPSVHAAPHELNNRPQAIQWLLSGRNRTGRKPHVRVARIDE